ncbi:MAG: 1-deoxy-D-xylulose-5-phosphate reductoisomerase [Alphaproteobacteria bacterium]|nr:1-deoxy-D-xylulose-5-phosphate reductoisomerase [Alphaproteobacteria bacterium]
MTARPVSVLGATGSVGANTLSVIAEHPERFRVVALAAGRNAAALVQQARAFRPEFAAIADPSGYPTLKEGLAGTGIEAAAGAEAVVEAARRDAEWVMAAIAGAAGLESTLAAVERGAVVALANKESLVCAGELMMAAARASGSMILPVDSEHNAIFQVFDARCREAVRRLILTASGGPFRCASRNAMAAVRPAEALKHPNWDMGAKITIDSATMMNKGLELIEAHHLFAMPGDAIDILVHPQSIVHSMVEYADGSVLAQLGTPDMRTPIAVALAWPERGAAAGERLDLSAVGRLDFEPPDPERFPALVLARAALESGGTEPAALSAANEVAVAAFLSERIGFLQIAEIAGDTVAELGSVRLSSLDDVRSADREARKVAERLVERTADRSR